MKTEFNKTQGLFDASAGNSFSLSHAKPSLRAKGSLAFTNVVADNESIKLTDALGRSLTFKVDAAVNTVDGSLDDDGNVILGTNAAGNAAGQVDRLVAVVNAVSGLSILAVDDGNTCTLYQEVNGASGNTTIDTFDAAGDAAANLTNSTKTNFSGGKNKGTAETATGIHFLLEEVSIDQTVLGAANHLDQNDVAVQLSHKLPANSAILRASLTQSAADASVEGNSGDYGLVISSDSKAVGAAKGNDQVIANTVATGLNLSGTTAASEIQAVGDKQFIQVFAQGAAHNAETGTVKLLVAIQYAGMGEPIKI
jgi:hypothetical protein